MSHRSKRLMDLIGAVAGLVVVYPVLVLVALAIRCTLGRPILFRQTRPGLDGVPFELLKFRTMKDAVDSDRKPLADATRLTRLGRFLRHTSLDELPELANILKGDMSFIGPRPLLMKYLPHYTPEQMRRHEVLPGITGWAQVNGRNTLSWEEKFALDVWYVDHANLMLDIKILLLTCKQVSKCEGISAKGCSTMPEFKGEANE
jgi:lipopolysaccharide/colanic/teichoic acid biosynthesis glycosyltransferase